MQCYNDAKQYLEQDWVYLYVSGGRVYLAVLLLKPSLAVKADTLIDT